MHCRTTVTGMASRTLWLARALRNLVTATMSKQ